VFRVERWSEVRSKRRSVGVARLLTGARRCSPLLDRATGYADKGIENAYACVVDDVNFKHLNDRQVLFRMCGGVEDVCSKGRGREKLIFSPELPRPATEVF
jgi:hypothetical protein